MRGPIALVGGNEWREPAASLDSFLLERSGTNLVTILPTATAKSRPDLAVETAARYFSAMGAEVEGVMVLSREDAENESAAKEIESARFMYLAGGDPGYLAETLRDTAVWRSIVAANDQGALLAGSSAGAMIMCEAIMRPAGSHMEQGLGMLPGLVVIPHHDRNLARLAKIFPVIGSRLKCLGIDECTGLVLDGDHCRILGAGSVSMYEAGELIWEAEAPSERERCLEVGSS